MGFKNLFDKIMPKKPDSPLDKLLKEATEAVVCKPITREDFERVHQQVMSRPFSSFQGVGMAVDYKEREERARLAEEHAKQLLMIKQDNALDLIKRHCLACRGYIGNSLLPPRVELTRKHHAETFSNSARIAITCPVCGYVMMFDVELSESEMLLPVPAAPELF